ncbi:MAG: branched-chain amino acid ABC transporter permease [Nitrososphaerota archaeon]|nr:branched-chain amino acid ABC transporter permease [Candidatus Calditenuaceae archaeon]MDW8073210.1 branched-chain amino acid ABC transporter permease [Nitrososphaerota archaeon]
MMPSDQIVRFILDLAPWIAAYLVISLSLNLEYGFGGIPNFGKVLCVTGGAFLIGALPGQLIVSAYNLGQGLNYFDNHAQIMPRVNDFLSRDPLLSIALLIFTLAMAMLVGGGLGLISSIPAVRLREEYLAMTLLAMGEILILIGDNYKNLIGGTLGVFVPSFLGWIPVPTRSYVLTAILVGIAVLVFVFVQLLTRSPYGRLLRSIRDDEVLAQALGRDIVSVKRKTIILAGALAGLAGAMLALTTGAVNAKNYSRANHTFIPWVMVLVGGAANNWGTALGVMVFMVSSRLIDAFKRELELYLPFDVVWLTPLLLSTTLLIVMFFRPGGIIPEARTQTLKPKELKELKKSTQPKN